MLANFEVSNEIDLNHGLLRHPLTPGPVAPNLYTTFWIGAITNTGDILTNVRDLIQRYSPCRLCGTISLIQDHTSMCFLWYCMGLIAKSSKL